ncbi:MAG TPA: formate dehydrogenase accessory sulfurtransferase FdhD [Burkholderiales bacterium]|nr:formate dehydrogenase accessory sulfurtransferase FdhD [Burkholderiales bacterium]
MNDHARWLATCSEVQLERWEGGQPTAARDSVAEETPLALIYNGLQHVVMMASPADLEDFALGFSLSEGVIETPAELHAFETDRVGDGIALYMDVDATRARALEAQRRNLAGRTGCGLCGAETIEQAVRHPAAVASGVRVTASALQDALARLAQRQQLNAKTGSVHAAAWATPEGEVVVVREDVGRHNALDKMIGALAREGRSFEHGFALITSRASFEMAQKAATVGITLLAAISAPTGLAIRLAQETGLTLIGFARGRSFNVYANPQRVTAA